MRESEEPGHLVGPGLTALVAPPVEPAENGQHVRLVQGPDFAERHLRPADRNNAVDRPSGRFVGALHRGQVRVSTHVVGGQKQVQDVGIRLRTLVPRVRGIDEQGFGVVGFKTVIHPGSLLGDVAVEVRSHDH